VHALSPTDSAFLWMETRDQPMHVAGLNLYTPPSGGGAHYVATVLAQWGQHLSALAPFNLRPVLRMGLWHWEEDRNFELDYHLRHLALPHPGRIRELLVMVSRLHGNLMDRNRPLWEAYVIEGLPHGRFATFIKIHHALVDGVTGARMMARGLSTTAAEQKPPLWAQDLAGPGAARDKPGPRGLLQQFLTLAKAGRDILPGVGSGLKDIFRVGVGDSAAAMPFQAPPSPFNVEISGSRRFAAQSHSLQRIKAIGAGSGATVNDVTLAICAGALRKYLLAQKKLPRKPLIAMVPVSLHGETGAGGNQVTLLLANLATHLTDPVARLQAIVRSTRDAKQRLSTMPRLQKMAHGMTTVAPMGPAIVTGSARQRPAFNVVISNVPGPQEMLFLNGARLDEVYPVSIVTHYLALNITISGYGDTLGFGFTACRRSVPALQRMLDYTDESMAELEAALGAAAATPTPTAAPRKAARKRAPARTAAQPAASRPAGSSGPRKRATKRPEST
jgi:diacylglycerol O-acyltransferase